ncbi:MAG: hypothetical protein DRH10_00925 [Deltaproteobacteria bacterium]|nr:MAG: hypothetical protein DRH10_00925 [Deltaproteobacteria bacterium]RLC88377.1 MAG: hypothetical protein DRJ03_02990 [Chloroflexota bacterium]
MGKKKQRYKYAWEAIEREYRSGQFSQGEIARRYGCSRQAISKKVKRYGWKKDLSEAVSKAANSKLVDIDAGVAGGVATRNARDDAKTIELAASRRVAVIELHRKDINSLRQLEEELIARLMDKPEKVYITQYQGKIIQKKLSLTVSEMAQAANNLANVQHKRIQLERQAYNLDSGNDDDKLPGVVVHDHGKDSYDNS